MRASFPLEAARPLLRIIKEIWETKGLLASVFGVIHYGFPHGFHGLWSVLTKRLEPRAPAFERSQYIALGLLLAIHVLLTRHMWIWFRKIQAASSSPWKDFGLSDIFQSLDAMTPLRGLHFILVRFGDDRRRIARSSPWHFRNSFLTLQSMIVILGIGKMEGPGGLLLAVHLAIQYDTYWLLNRQAAASLGFYTSPSRLELKYRHKPRFAQAALVQMVIYGLAITLLLNNRPKAIFVLYILPLTSFGTILLFTIHGHTPDYVNSTPTVYGNYSDKLCAVCESARMARGAFGSDFRAAHHQTKDSLLKSARSGCRICAAVWQHASRIPEDFVNTLMYWKPFTQLSNRGFGTVRCNGIDTDFEYKKGQVPDRWIRSGGVDIRQRIANDDIPSHTGSEESLDLAINWLKNCIIFHGVCSTNHEVTFKPSRLLFLETHSVRLHTVSEMPERLRYLTLSHCWGRHQLVRLLESNLDAFCEDIPYQLLPQTFRDAIRVARRLGFAYLWIDSLCIIQDSKDDWNHEARLMGKIYTHATCNIAASDAPDSTHGCLYPRSPRAIQPDAVDLGPAEGKHYILNRTDIYEHQHILYTRAWVLQEAILARRTLDCGRGQLFWRCGEMRASEVWPGGVPTNIYNDDHPASKFKAISAENDQVILNANIISQRLDTHSTRSQIPRAPGKGSVERYTDAPFAFWAAIVSDYTSMNLTKDEDRPIAIAGITDVFRPFFGAHHYGMWRIFMPLELLWSVSGVSKRPSTVRAPSWSWLATESPVSYAHCEFKYGRDVLLTRFIEIEDMRLRVETRLLRAKWTGIGQPASISSIEGESRWLRWRGIPTIPEEYGDISFDYPEDAPDSGTDIFLMCIQIHKQYEKRALGLVLREVEDGVFERIGYFQDYRLEILPFLKRAERREIVLV